MKECLTCKRLYENTKEKIKTIFSTEFILNCYDSRNMTLYEDIFTNEQIINLLKNPEIIFTATKFLDNNLNISQASKNSFMHRNTLIYRIEKIYKITGLNIKKFNDAVTFLNMLQVYKRLNIA